MQLTWARRRQIITLAIVFGSVALIFLLGWLIFRAGPSCHNNKKDSNEEGVDCGGVCALQCADTHPRLQSLWTKTFTVRDGVYDVASLVQNPNNDAGVSQLDYTVDLYDASGRSILSRDFSTFVNPGDSALLIGGGLSAGGILATQARLTIHPDYVYVRASTTPNKLVSVLNYDLITPNTTPVLYATIENETPNTLTNIPVTALVSDINGPLGVSQTFVESLGPHQQKEVSFTWPRKFEYDAASRRCATPVDVMLVLDRSGSMASDGTNPSQPLTKAKDAAAAFASQLSSDDQAGYVSFATNVTEPIEEPLTKNLPDVAAAIHGTEIATSGLQETNIAGALVSARAELSTQRARKGAKQAIVLLTDGSPTDPKNPNDAEDKQYPYQMATQVATDLKSRGISVYTVGLGEDIDANFLKSLATHPEYYFAAPTGDQIFAAYREIASDICQKGPAVVEITPRIDEVGQTATH